MKKLLILLPIVASSFSITAQITFERQVIACAGSVVSTGGLTFCYTVGETETWTGTQGEFTFTQGFQQPHQAITAAKEAHFDVGYKIYPNPAVSQVQLELTTQTPTELIISLYAMDGMLLAEMSATVVGQESQYLDVSQLPSGSYILSFYDMKKDAFATERLQVAR
ncbi:MAG: T9SS type A sorting domain-containing protein [Saprospiraceae bacterium]|nr:T9SS type A sorting domain-containing protein [Saprospiraceae bacterium]